MLNFSNTYIYPFVYNLGLSGIFFVFLGLLPDLCVTFFFLTAFFTVFFPGSALALSTISFFSSFSFFATSFLNTSIFLAISDFFCLFLFSSHDFLLLLFCKVCWSEFWNQLFYYSNWVPLIFPCFHFL